MNLRRMFYLAVLVALGAGLGTNAFAQPIFENNTPAGFSPSDSTKSPNFVIEKEVTVQVDLNQPATFSYPVVGNFQKLERSVPYDNTPQTAAYMSQAVAVDDAGNIHRAWVEQRGVADRNNNASTPVYGVVYAKSLNGGRTFSDTVSVSGTMRFDMITSNLSMTSGFSTVDLVVDSKGNPRVVYAMDWSADGSHGWNTTQLMARCDPPTPGTSNRRQHNNILFNYSNDGGSSWFPANGAVVVNDTSTITKVYNRNVVAGNAELNGGTYPGRKTAFPRMVISQTDDVFIVYQRGMRQMNRHGGTGAAVTIANAGTEQYQAMGVAGLQGTGSPPPDIMLAKMDADSLKLGNARPVAVGSLGNVGSVGGIRIDPDELRGIAPDIAIGDDDVLHIVWFAPDADQIQHKTIPADQWSDVTSFGLNQDVAGTSVGTFDDDIVTNIGVGPGNVADGGWLFTQLDYNYTAQTHLFPTVAVDRKRTPDRVYVFWKHIDEAPNGGSGSDENINYTTYNYDGRTGAGGTFGAVATVFPTGSTLLNYSNTAMFQNGTRYGIGDYWGYVDRVAVVMDGRKGNQSDVHIVFSGGESVTQSGLSHIYEGTAATASAIVTSSGPHVFGANGFEGNAASLYYTRFNGLEWELPQVLASANNSSADGMETSIGNFYQHLFEPDLAMRSGDDSIYMTFVGGSSVVVGADYAGAGGTSHRGSGRGYAGQHNVPIAPIAFFKKIGRVVTNEDVSIPSGANVYRMPYTPTNPQRFASNRNMVTVTAGATTDGSGIGYATPGGSTAPGGFLTGQWQGIGSFTLGVTTLTAPGVAGAVYKGSVSLPEALNDAGLWQGQADDDGSSGYGEWGDDGDKGGLLVKLNVLGSDSPSNLFVVAGSTPSQASNLVSYGTGFEVDVTQSSQSIAIARGRSENGFDYYYRPSNSSHVRGLYQQDNDGIGSLAAPVLATDFNMPVVPTVALGGHEIRAPMGSYFQMGANINIVAANVAPVARID